MRPLIAAALLATLPQQALADCVYTGAKRAYLTCIYDQVLTNAADIAAQAASLLGLDLRVSDAETGVGALQTDLGLLQTDLGALAGAVSTLEGGLGAAESNIAALELAQSGLSSDLGLLDADVAAAVGDISALEADVSTLQSEAFFSAGGAITGPTLLSLPDGNDFGGNQDGVATDWTHFLAVSAAGGAAGTAVAVSDFTFTTDKWRAIFEGEWSNNYEGGGLVGLPPIIEISNTVTSGNTAPNTVRVGAVTLTFSRNTTSGKLQAVATSSVAGTYGASFRGNVTIIPHKQGTAGGQSMSLSSGINYYGALNRQEGGSVTGKLLRNVTAGTYTMYRADVHGAGIVVVKLGGDSAGVCRYTELGVFTDSWSRLGNAKTYNPSGAACPSVSVAVSGSELRVTLGAHSYADLSMSVYGFGDLTAL